MRIAVAADHAGYALKATIVSDLMALGHTVEDLGTHHPEPEDDYPDFAGAVAGRVAGAGNEVRGVLICSSGIGVDITANKFPGVRSALAMSVEHIKHGRGADDVNVLSLAAEYLKPVDAIAFARAFLTTPFDGEARRLRRLAKIVKIEREH